MKISPRNDRAFTWVEGLVVLVVILVLVLASIPRIPDDRVSGMMTSILSNARQLQIATQMMTLDGLNAGKGMSWTTHFVKGEPARPATLAEYFDALTRENYLSKNDLRKLLTAPGVAPGIDALATDPIPFKFFQFDDTAPAEQPFCVTANWENRQITGALPYGKKGFVVFAKGGSGGVFRRQEDARSPHIFPVSNEAGARFSYTTLK